MADKKYRIQVSSLELDELKNNFIKIFGKSPYSCDYDAEDSFNDFADQVYPIWWKLRDFMKGIFAFVGIKEITFDITTYENKNYRTWEVECYHRDERKFGKKLLFTLNVENFRREGKYDYTFNLCRRT